MEKNLVSFSGTLMIGFDQLLDFVVQQPLDALISRLSSNYTIAEIIEAATKADKERRERIDKINQRWFEDQIAELKAMHVAEIQRLKAESEQALAALQDRARQLVVETAEVEQERLTQQEDPLTNIKPVRKFYEKLCAYTGCGQRFSTTEKESKYCSRDCTSKQFKVEGSKLTDDIKNCLFCETPFQVSVFGKSKKYCSMVCSARHYRRTHKEQYANYAKKHKEKKLLQVQDSPQPTQEAERLEQ